MVLFLLEETGESGITGPHGLNGTKGKRAN